MPRRACKGWKKSVARASRRTRAAISGVSERRLETVALGRRKEAGMRDSFWEEESS